MKALPIGIQSFANLSERDYLYVDKTRDIHRLVTTGDVYFLSRPRRFGKSLLISTLEAIFKGRKELFEGLYIYDRWDWSQQHPVVRLDWSIIKHATAGELERGLLGFINKIAHNHQLTLTMEYATERFDELLEGLHHQTGKKVVVLVDEYDMPILEKLESPDEIDAIRNYLQSFYKALKASGEHLRFVFLTGVSKFAGVSLFSGLNNLRDITLSDEFSVICGYTQQELEHYFLEHIRHLAGKYAMTNEALLEEIRTWYNGYSWDGCTPVYNPFSTLLLFTEKEFVNYWFRTGTPTFLIEILKKRNQLKLILEPVTVGTNIFDSFDPIYIDGLPLLFQTGYLTIKNKTFVSGRPQYTLGIPNSEVNESLLVYLLNAYSAYPVSQTEGLKARMQQQIRDNDASGLEQSLREMLAYIPYPLHVKNEAYYHSLLLLWIKMIGFDIQGEIMTNTGRIDAVWHQPGLTVVAEIKYHAQKSIDGLFTDAMQQIHDRRYYERYLDRTVVLLGRGLYRRGGWMPDEQG
ncbi:MAG: ATP-binding protein [Tannerellaceae bacterium]|jgi:hypothetical protein|nr:ATP-binding protein [Tannerellaceae bacterium]